MGLFKSREEKNGNAFVNDYFFHWGQRVKTWRSMKAEPDQWLLSMVHTTACTHAFRQATLRGDTGMRRQETANNLWAMARQKYSEYSFGEAPTLLK